jgi:23S rRNA pseudouridine2605 synthase
MEERVQKILARSGYGSRRECETFISQGRVKVNGRVIKLGDKADAQTDQITFDDRPVQVQTTFVYIALYKPRGVLSAAYSPEGRKTVCDLVDIPTRLYPVGRLDIDSEGLILLTNDGELANLITHPRYGHEKEYRVLVAKKPDEEQINNWRRGIVLTDGYKTQPAEVKVDTIVGKGAWLRIVLREGRKRQIRETGALLGLPVVRIIRVRIGDVYLGLLKPRQWRYLTQAEINSLKQLKTNSNLPNPKRR